jgi:hypothetical protein
MCKNTAGSNKYEWTENIRVYLNVWRHSHTKDIVQSRLYGLDVSRNHAEYKNTGIVSSRLCSRIY